MTKFKNQLTVKQLNYCILFLLIIHSPYAVGQISNSTKDSLYIHQIEEAPGKHKVLHAEPLYIDLIRDLGARKGEREWNVGLGMTDKTNLIPMKP